MNTVKFFFSVMLLAVLLSACGAPQPAPTEAPAPVPTNTPKPLPTNTPEPTPTLQPTETPVGQLFRDDFTDVLQPGWTWRDEKSTRWSITKDGWLQILGEDSSLLASGYQSNLLCRPAPTGDFQVTLHLSADPSENFQQATLYLYQDGVNYIAINRGFCGPCVNGGGAVFMEYKLARAWGAYNAPTGDTDLYLRLVNEGQTVKGYYAFEPDVWQYLGKVGNFFAKADICLGVSNVDTAGINADLVGRFDYIEFTVP